MKTDMLYCKICKRYRGFYLKNGMWICIGCGFEIKDEKKNEN